MDKIYSRRRILLPKFAFFSHHKKERNHKNMAKILKITCIVSIAIITANLILQAISPILDEQCKNIAKAIATKVSNEQATVVMAKYQYEDLCSITKDNNRQYSHD